MSLSTEQPEQQTEARGLSAEELSLIGAFDADSIALAIHEGDDFEIVYCNTKMQKLLNRADVSGKQLEDSVPEERGEVAYGFCVLTAQRDESGEIVDLDVLLRMQLEPFRERTGVRIAMGGPRVLLSAAAAQTIGMAVHELATNAIKYGALWNDTGTISIRWARDDAGSFSMSWNEAGGPPAEEPEHRGFGYTVIKQVVEGTLGGTVTLSFSGDGFRWQLDCEDRCLTELEKTPSPPAPDTPAPEKLTDSAILVVEDDALIAFDLAATIEAEGIKVVGPVGAVADALDLLAREHVSGAFLDINLGSETSEPIARELRERSIPFVVLSGYAREQQPEILRSAPFIPKPVDPAAILPVLRRELGVSAD